MINAIKLIYTTAPNSNGGLCNPPRMVLKHHKKMLYDNAYFEERLKSGFGDGDLRLNG